MNEDNFIPNTNDNINGLINLCEIREKIREVIRDNFPQYLDSVNTASVTKSPDIIVDNSNFFEDIFNQVLDSTIYSIFSKNYNLDEISNLNENIIKNNDIQNYIKSKENFLFKSQAFEAIPTAALMLSSIKSQIKKEDSWQKKEDGTAYSQHKAKGNPQNYIEHYITTPGDITLLPWNEAQQIIDKFGFTSAKLHLIFAAYTMKQEKPWEDIFILNGSDLMKEIGWDKRTDLPKHHKLLEIAKTAFALDCLLVKALWIEGKNKKGGINASTPVGRMWNITIVPYGQMNLSGKIEEPLEVQIVVQPGTWTKYFLNRAGAESREALYQFGYLAQQVLTIDPYHEELTLRLAIHITLDSRVRLDGNYKVKELLEIALTLPEIDKALSNFRRAYDLKKRWDNALKHLLNKLGWQIEFDQKTYPKWLRPDCKDKKPKGYFKKLLNAKLTIKPPAPIPKLITSKTKPGVRRLQSKTNDITPEDISLTSSQMREARTAKGWSQTKLASVLGVSQNFVSLVERGKRPLNLQQAALVRILLDIQF